MTTTENLHDGCVCRVCMDAPRDAEGRIVDDPDPQMALYSPSTIGVRPELLFELTRLAIDSIRATQGEAHPWTLAVAAAGIDALAFSLHGDELLAIANERAPEVFAYTRRAQPTSGDPF